MKKDEYNEIMGSLKTFAEDVATANIELIRLATAIVDYQNPNLAKLGVLLISPKYRKEQELFDIKRNEVLDQLIEELNELSVEDVSRLKKKYIVKLRLKDLEKDF